MNRRIFLIKSSRIPLGFFGLSMAASWISDRATACTASEEPTDEGPEDQVFESISSEQEGVKSFAFYQGLRPTETRSPDRTDGTFSNMPCIKKSDVDLGTEKIYLFWHGHGANVHRFKVTSEHFAKLATGLSVELYTDLVDGHRHALQITPNLVCKASR
ncbi:MAG: hypothetical protein NTV34_18735 [Proteobacteria bacterium]|nr:hypothetical protein [Pseudomonadota bacterium]